MPPIHFFASRGNESIQQIVRLNPEPLAPGNLDERPRLIFFAQVVAEFGGTARSECDHLVGEVRVAIGGFSVAKSAQSFDHRVLRLRLTRIDDVIDLRHIAEVGMLFFAVGG